MYSIASTLAYIVVSDRGSTREPSCQTVLTQDFHSNHWAKQRGFFDFPFNSALQGKAGKTITSYAQEKVEGAVIKHTT